MKSTTINGLTLYEGILSGAAAVIANKSALNKINVFPVADGDTGSNLSATMRAVIDNLSASDDLSIVAESAAEGALSGARGNSGIIFAQFFYGFYMAVKPRREIDPETFIQAMKTASSRLYEVMLNPVEGTILTVIRSWVDAMEHHHRTGQEFKAFVSLTLADSLKALEHTTDQLDILRENGVVDSGAKGFYNFLEGISHYLIAGKVPDLALTAAESVPQWEAPPDRHETESLYRYCCEAMVSSRRSELLDIRQVKAAMASFGDSLVIAGGDQRIRLHMHTSRPEAMFAKLLEFGSLSQIKADDMHLQMAVVKGPKAKIAVVTDSIADLPENYADEHQIFVLPLQLEVDGVVHLDRVSLSAKGFYKINKHLKQQPLSSLPSIKQVESLFHFLAEHYEAVVVLSVSDQLSGTYQMVASVAELLRQQGMKIAVVNTLKNSGAQGLLVMEAVKMAQSGMALEAITNQLHQMIPRTKILVAVDTVKYLARSGRVSQSAGTVAKWLHLKPIMTLDEQGKGKAYGGTISHQAVLEKIKKAVLKDHKRYGIVSYNVVHGDCQERAEKFAEEMKQLLGLPADYIGEISPIVGAVAGEGAVAISYQIRQE